MTKPWQLTLFLSVSVNHLAVWLDHDSWLPSFNQSSRCVTRPRQLNLFQSVGHLAWWLDHDSWLPSVNQSSRCVTRPTQLTLFQSLWVTRPWQLTSFCQASCCVNRPRQLTLFQSLSHLAGWLDHDSRLPALWLNLDSSLYFYESSGCVTADKTADLLLSLSSCMARPD